MEKLIRKEAQLEIIRDLLQRLDMIIESNESEVAAIVEQGEDSPKWEHECLPNYRAKIEEAKRFREWVESKI